MLNEKLVFISVFITIFADFDYFLDTLKGKVRPNRVTWFLWALAPLIAFSAMVSEGVGISAWMTFATGFVPLLIVAGSFVSKKAYWELGKFDIICGLISVLALVLWYITNTGLVAIILAIASDALAALPTIVKAYKEPETESVRVYLLNALAVAITLATISSWDIETVAFPLYLITVCLIIALTIARNKIFRKVKN